MPGPTSSDKPEGRWHRLWSKPRTKWLLTIPVGGLLMFVFGIIAWGGFNTVLEATNTEGFCISCHEMRDNVYEEYKKTPHYQNPSGVRATCPDCHVPKEWSAKVWRKFQATYHELPAKVLGKIDTRDKFVARRERMANNVWAAMKANDSRECRNCHALQFMDIDAQDKSARKKHTAEWKAEKGDTCIDCHKGIAHTLPGDEEEEEETATAAPDSDK